MAALIFYIKALGVIGWIAIDTAIGFFIWIPLKILMTDILGIWKIDLNHWYGQFMAWGGLRIAGIRVDVEGRENLHAHQPCIYCINHQDNFDVVLSSGLFPKRTVLIGKKELKIFPFFGQYYWAAGNILIDRKKRRQAIAGLEEALALLKKDGRSVWIFPEGTRNKTEGELLPFKKGAFYMAIKAQVPVVPVVHRPFKHIFDSQGKRFPGGEHLVHVLEPIHTRGLTQDDAEAVMEATRGAMLEVFRKNGYSRRGYS